MLAAPTAQAQACGGGFNSVKVSDSKGKSIRGVSIELVAALPDGDYFKGGLYNKYGLILGKVIKVLERDVEELIKRKVPGDWTTDRCDNPSKQIANVTRVKTGASENPSNRELGFCTLETFFKPFLLKVSAPGYRTDFYVGTYLGGCGKTYTFILKKARGNVGKTKNLFGKSMFQSKAMPNNSFNPTPH